MLKKSLLFLLLASFVFISGCAEQPDKKLKSSMPETVPDEVSIREAQILPEKEPKVELPSDLPVEQEVGQKEEILKKVQQIMWYFDTEWKSSSKPPTCSEPLALQTPVDINLATSILYPGQMRGGHYKAHGGFRFDKSKNDDIMVKAPLDGLLVRGSRYIESGEIQYMFDIINPCGIMFRFDHLLTLSPKFAEAAEQLRQPLVDDSRTTNIGPIQIKAGEVVATAVGFKKTGNVGVDWGVYNLRQKNQASKNPEWLQQHQGEQAPYALCWLDLLHPEDSTKAKSLPGGDSVSGTQSDYCE